MSGHSRAGEGDGYECRGSFGIVKRPRNDVGTRGSEFLGFKMARHEKKGRTKSCIFEEPLR